MKFEHPTSEGTLKEKFLMNAALRADLSSTVFSSGNCIGIGVHDAMSARIASSHAFDFLWIGSFGVSAAHGFPDAAVLNPDELAQVVRQVARSSRLPLMVDLDSGYGDIGKVYRVVEDIALAGASAVAIEDNPLSKRSSLYERYKLDLASVREHVDRIRAANFALSDSGSHCRVIARTEALVAGLGVEEALERANAYVDAGAAAVFVQSRDRTGRDVLEFLSNWNRRSPVFLAPTLLHGTSPPELFSAGATHVIFANQVIRATHRAIETVSARLAKHRNMGSVDDLVSSVQAVSDSAGAEQLFELEQRVAAETEDVRR